MKITIRCSQERLELEVQDNGIGFDSQKARVGGLGLRNMRERAALLGGTLDIRTAPGAGTSIHFYAEIKEQHGKNAIADR
jgi:signal transduction histidine kinase